MLVDLSTLPSCLLLMDGCFQRVNPVRTWFSSHINTQVIFIPIIKHDFLKNKKQTHALDNCHKTSSYNVCYGGPTLHFHKLVPKQGFEPLSLLMDTSSKTYHLTLLCVCVKNTRITFLT